MLIKIRKAQSMVEYTLLLAALVLAFIYAASQIFGQKAESQANVAGNIFEKATNEVASKFGVQ